METLNFQLQQLAYLLQYSEKTNEIKSLIDSITNKINSIKKKSSISTIENELNDFDFCDDILH